MADRKSTRDRAARPGLSVRWPQPMLAIFVVTTAAGLLTIVSLSPPMLVLPVASLAAIAGAAVVALVAWQLGVERHSRSITSWDLAGALAFIGCGAAALTSPEQILHLVGHAPMPR
jgi:hypothetical protein